MLCINGSGELNQGHALIPTEPPAHKSVRTSPGSMHPAVGHSCLCSTLVFNLFSSSETSLELLHSSCQNVGCLLLNFILMSCFSGIITLHQKCWPIYCLCKKMTIKSMLHNSPKSIKVFCNVNGSVGLRGVSSCRPEWMPGSSKGMFFILLACSLLTAKFIHSKKLAQTLGWEQGWDGDRSAESRLTSPWHHKLVRWWALTGTDKSNPII